MLDWLRDHQWLLWTLGAASIAIFIASLLAVPALVARLPPDYFTHAQRPPRLPRLRHPLARAAALTAKNLLGAALVAAGLAMLVLPGQGLLTLLVGLFLLDLPGKYGLEKRLVARRWVHRPINWLRSRRGRAPLRLSQTATHRTASGNGSTLEQPAHAQGTRTQAVLDVARADPTLP